MKKEDFIDGGVYGMEWIGDTYIFQWINNSIKAYRRNEGCAYSHGGTWGTGYKPFMPTQEQIDKFIANNQYFKPELYKVKDNYSVY